MTTCRGCDAPMLWAINEKSGKGIPLNPDPIDDGSLVSTGETTADGRMIVRAVKRGDDTGIMPRYNPHFVSCPNAAEFRKR